MNGDGTLRIKGADGRQIDIPRGRWYTLPKARTERTMKDDLSGGEHRVYACLGLMTMGWQMEEAVVGEKSGKIVATNGSRCRYATTGDIARITGMDQANVRKYLDGLDTKGYGERRPITGNGLHKGNVVICSYASPRVPKEGEKRLRATSFLESAPDSVKPILAFAKRHRIPIPDGLDEVARNLFIEKYAPMARDLEDIENKIARELKSDYAPAPLYKEERTERTFKEPQPPAGQPVLAPPAPEAAPAPNPTPTTPPDPPLPPPPEEAKPAGRPEGLGFEKEPLKPLIEQHLKTIPIPALTPETVAEVAKHITNSELLEQFKEVTTKPTKSPPRTWGLIIAKAREVAQDGERYREAKSAAENGDGNGHSPPRMSRSEQKMADYVRRRQEEKGRAGK
jgi:Mn-dependent DtxR family transcriptional regulator